MKTMTSFVHRILLLTFTIVMTACSASTGPYVGVETIPQEKAEADVTIHEGDDLTVRVFNQDSFTTQQKVRADGKIAIPVLGEVVAKGKRPAQLAAELQEKMKNYIVAPSVSVIIAQATQITVSVLGEVKNAGTFNVDNGSGVLVALASAGGLSDFADNEKIFVVRKALPQRIRFKLTDLRAGEPHATGFQLKTGDIIVVE